MRRCDFILAWYILGRILQRVMSHLVARVFYQTNSSNAGTSGPLSDVRHRRKSDTFAVHNPNIVRFILAFVTLSCV
jgi:hypothetical protein